MQIIHCEHNIVLFSTNALVNEQKYENSRIIKQEANACKLSHRFEEKKNIKTLFEIFKN